MREDFAMQRASGGPCLLSSRVSVPVQVLPWGLKSFHRPQQWRRLPLSYKTIPRRSKSSQSVENKQGRPEESLQTAKDVHVGQAKQVRGVGSCV